MQEALIDKIYEASVVPELWPEVLEDIAGLTQAAGGLFFAARERNLCWTASDKVYDAFHDYVTQGWLHRCGRRICLFQKAHSEFLREQDYWSSTEIDSNEIYRDFFRPRNLGWSAGTGIAVPTGDNIVFSIERDLERGPMETDYVGLLNELRPHLARSAIIAARLGLKSASSARETFDKLGVPVILLGVDGSVVDTGNLPESVEDQIIWRADSHVAFRDAVASEQLRDGLASLASYRAGGVTSFPVRDAGGKPVMVAHLLPINRSASDIFARGYALMVLIPLSSRIEPPPDLLRSLFDLTATEAGVARQLAKGLSADEIAAALGVSMATVRTHIRRVLEKTGSSRQAEAVSLLSSISLER